MLIGLIFTLAVAEEGAVPWWNYPGVEVWKFVNLFVFILAAIYILRRPLSDALKGRRERIREELRKAQDERDRALAELQEMEAKLSHLDEEVAAIRLQAEGEAVAERERLSKETEVELAKLREASEREIESAGKAAKQELREFAARQSLKLAEEAIRQEIRDEDDARLIGLSVEQLGENRN
ncbi:MAG TPA: ATP synthase F0 subunit B [Pyrinomonadaceae bacterium]|nr:ATP synthase F0 subunit B [Pyrinomonadaceae bacterium]